MCVKRPARAGKVTLFVSNRNLFPKLRSQLFFPKRDFHIKRARAIRNTKHDQQKNSNNASRGVSRPNDNERVVETQAVVVVVVVVADKGVIFFAEQTSDV